MVGLSGPNNQKLLRLGSLSKFEDFSPLPHSEVLNGKIT